MHHTAAPQMDSRRLSTPSVQPENNCMVRLESSPRNKVLPDVPCKVPRFQYVDFPSLHQCIKQLSVPPLEGWLASRPLQKAPIGDSRSPEEKVPKFKYVDYPSLYHCIQQLSVPPLESWSSGLAKTNTEDVKGDQMGEQNSSHKLDDGVKVEKMQGCEAKCQSERNTTRQRTVCVVQHQSLATGKGQDLHKSSDSRVETLTSSGSTPETDMAGPKYEKCVRATVISLVRTQKHRMEQTES